VSDRGPWGPPPPPSYPYPYPPYPQKKPGVGHIVAYIVGGTLFAVGAAAYVRVNQGYNVCKSGLGVFGQAVSSGVAYRCGIVNMIHAVSLVLLAAGAITALIGALVRLGRSN
jgi:hypothetical protein